MRRKIAPSQGFTLMELMIVMAIILIIAAVAGPNLVQSGIAARENSAISAVRTLITAQYAYESTKSYGSFAPDMTVLGSVVNLSLQTALVTIVDIVPPEGTSSTLTLETDQGEVRLQGRMGAKVVHAGWEPKGQMGIGLLGIDFDESPEEVREALAPLIPPETQD